MLISLCCLGCAFHVMLCRAVTSCHNTGFLSACFLCSSVDIACSGASGGSLVASALLSGISHFI